MRPPEFSHVWRCAKMRLIIPPPEDAARCCRRADLPEPLDPTTKICLPASSSTVRGWPEGCGIDHCMMCVRLERNDLSYRIVWNDSR